MSLSTYNISQMRIVPSLQLSTCPLDSRYLLPANFIELGLGNPVSEEDDPCRNLGRFVAEVLY